MKVESITKDDIIFLERAAELSHKGVQNNQGGPFGALIVKDNKIIAEAFNQVTSTDDPTAHAEVVAIRLACKKLKTFILDETTIYTSCEPCPMCLASIYWARISKICYCNSREDAKAIGFDDSFIYDEIKAPLEKRTIPIIRYQLDKASEAFKEWSAKSDKIKY